MILCAVTVNETDVLLMEHLARRLHTIEYCNSNSAASHYDARLRYSLFCTYTSELLDWLDAIFAES